jgi:GAF domain-containing protein
MTPGPTERDGPSQWNEADRLAMLEAYAILDTPPEQAFDDLARLAAMMCKAPVALVNFLSEDRQWFKAKVGLGRRETPIDIAFCTHVIRQSHLFVVPDTTKDHRFNCNPLVTEEPFLRFYAGAPRDIVRSGLCSSTWHYPRARRGLDGARTTGHHRP